MNGSKKISQFPSAFELYDIDLIPIVHEGSNFKISGGAFKASLTANFASKDDLTALQDALDRLKNEVYQNYIALQQQIVEGDNKVRQDLQYQISSYYDQLSQSILSLDNKYANEISKVYNTIQSIVVDLDGVASEEDLKALEARMATAEKLIAEIIASGGGGGTPGYHTQSTATIFPLSEYYLTGVQSRLEATDTLNQALAKLEGRLITVEETGGGGTGVYLIKMGDITQPSDTNAYSALRARDEFLKRKEDDTAEGKITFLNGWQAGPSFTEGFLGEGSALVNKDGQWQLTVDDLFVRGSAEFNELLINEIRATGGDIIVSLADMEIVRVEALSNGNWRCYFDNMDGTIPNKFVSNDQAICQKFEGKNVKRYWRRVLSVGVDFVELSLTDCEAGSAIPEVGDKLVQLGNRTDTTRQAAIYISAKGSEGPSIKMYDGIGQAPDSYSLVGKERTVIGKDSKFVGTITQVQNNNYYPVVIDKGTWVQGQPYYANDRVSHNGSLWLCVVPSGTTTEEPGTGSDWELQVAAGAKGDPGQSGSDVGKWVKITGEGQNFFYNNSTYSGDPTPTQITLTCDTYGIDNPTYSWTLDGTSTVLGTARTLTITPDMITGTARYILIRCTVTADSDTFHDIAQVGRVGTGSDALALEVDNYQMSAVYDYTGTTPVTDLSTVKAHIRAKVGTHTRLPITNVTYEVTDGIAAIGVEIVSAEPDRPSENSQIDVTWISLTTDQATVKISFDTSYGRFSQDIKMLKLRNGEPGQDGEAGPEGRPVSEVIVSGENLFIIHNDDSVEPQSITLTATARNITTPVYKWEWAYTPDDTWNTISGATTNRLQVSPSSYGFQSGVARSIVFKVTVTGMNGEEAVTRTDMQTIAKLYDGQDGEGTYTAHLYNEATTVASDSNGLVSTSERNTAKTGYALWLGTQLLDYTAYSVSVTTRTGSSSDTAAVNTSTREVYVTGLSATSLSTVVFKVEFKIDNVVVATKDFTVTKAPGGAAGDYKITVWTTPTNQNATPIRPTWQNIPADGSTTGTSGAGNLAYWYKYVPTGTPVWRSEATVDGKTGSIKPFTEGGTTYYWTLPILTQGSSGNWVTYAFATTNLGRPSNIAEVPVPQGWADAPSSSSSTWWMTKATINGNTGAGVVGIDGYVWSYPLLMTGTKGDTGSAGSDGNWMRTLWSNGTSTAPSASTPSASTSSLTPSGWSTTVPTLTTTYPELWMITAQVNGATGALIYGYTASSRYWSLPVKVSGEDGKDGIDGEHTEYMYAIHDSYTASPIYFPTSRTPGSSWSLTVPTVTTAKPYVWVTSARISGTDTLIGQWNKPTCMSGAPGADGADGPQGPSLNFTGKWASGRQYFNTATYRDIVYYDSSTESYKGYYMCIRSHTSTSSIPPAGSSSSATYWEKFGGSYTSLATGLMFAETALIAGWNFNDDYIWSKTAYGGYGVVFNGSDKNTSVNVPLIAAGSNALTDGTNGKYMINPNASFKIWKTGMLTVGDGVTASNAGVSGVGTSDSSIRFWAGASSSSSSSAPFRVNQAGELTATKATITGNITATSGTFTGTVYANAGSFTGSVKTGTGGTRAELEMDGASSFRIYQSGFSSPVFSISGGSEPNIFIMDTSGTGNTRIQSAYTRIVATSGSYAMNIGWSGTTVSIGPDSAGRWPSSANGGRIWRDSNGYLHAN